MFTGHSRTLLLRVPAFFVVLILWVVTAASVSAQQIVFSGQVPGSGGLAIYLVNPDGSSLVNLTSGPYDFLPQWSPDGSRVTFVREANNFNEIMVVNVDGTGLINVSNSPTANEFKPRWLPDGRIIFTSDRDGNQEIYRVNADGTGLVNLTNNSAVDANADASPFTIDHLAAIYFQTNRDGNFEIYSMDYSGGNLTRLTNNAVADVEPKWGRLDKIAYEALVNFNWEVFVRNGDGSSPLQLTDNGALSSRVSDFYPWSRDGTRILIERSPLGGSPDIWIVNANGTGLTNLTNSLTTYDSKPTFSPDGQQVAFLRDTDLYVMSADGSVPTNLTNGTLLAYTPQWSTSHSPVADQDLEIRRFRVTSRWNGRRPIDISLTVQNMGTSQVGFVASATVVGVQNGAQIYNETVLVSDPRGGGSSTFDFPPYTPITTGDIVWTVTVDDPYPDLDEATATTVVQ